MKLKLRFANSSFKNKNDFSLKLLPTIWVIHKSTNELRNLALRHNSKSESKMMFNYTSVFFSWLAWSVVLTIGREL